VLAFCVEAIKKMARPVSPAREMEWIAFIATKPHYWIEKLSYYTGTTHTQYFPNLSVCERFPFRAAQTNSIHICTDL
jgi:hypothetical protein